MKNWKSTSAFFLFVGSYIYTVYMGRADNILYVTGYIAFWSSVLMMLRNELTPVLIEKLIDVLSNKGK